MFFATCCVSQKEADFSMLVAVPCGNSHVEILQQTQNMRTGFISYLQQKQAAGIVNVPTPGSTTVSCQHVLGRVAVNIAMFHLIADVLKTRCG